MVVVHEPQQLVIEDRDGMEFFEFHHAPVCRIRRQPGGRLG